MNNSISKAALLSRITQEVPENSFVVPGSTPVVSFGDLYSANTVTIGINPSVDEFMTRQNPRKLLPPVSKRLVDMQVLGMPKATYVPKAQAEQVLTGCFDYFKNNPYHWFNKLQKYMLDPVGVSYFDGTAAHLDLVQWATEPVWQKIPDPKVSERLVAADQDFLTNLLQNGKYSKILLNGATVVKTMSDLGLFKLTEIGRINYGSKSSLLFEGKFGSTKVLATSLNIPSAHGLEGPEKVANWLVDCS